MNQNKNDNCVEIFHKLKPHMSVIKVA